MWNFRSKNDDYQKWTFMMSWPSWNVTLNNNYLIKVKCKCQHVQMGLGTNVGYRLHSLPPEYYTYLCFCMTTFILQWNSAVSHCNHAYHVHLSPWFLLWTPEHARTHPFYILYLMLASPLSVPSPLPLHLSLAVITFPRIQCGGSRSCNPVASHISLAINQHLPPALHSPSPFSLSPMTILSL